MTNQSTLSPIDLAETALGASFYDKRTEIDITDLDGERANIAVVALEKVIGHRDKMVDVAKKMGMLVTPDEWRPSKPEIDMFNTALGLERKRLQMLLGIEAYIQDYKTGETDTELLDYQQEVFDDLLRFVQSKRAEDGSKRGRISMATGTGKTAVFSLLIDALKYKEDPADPVRVLVIVPNQDILLQTVGENGEKGLGRFAPHLDVGSYYHRRKQLHKEVVVMTDESFNMLMDSGELQKQKFNAVIVDEAHTALGEKTLPNIERFCDKDKIAFALTATPYVNEDKQVSHTFPYEIHNSTLMDALEAGRLAPLQCSVVKAHVPEDVSQDLLTRVARNEIERIAKGIQREASARTALDFTESMVAQGLQVLIKCAPGNNLAEAKMMARRASKLRITDPRTGMERNIVAEVVSGTMSPEERQAVYDAYNRGEVDVLTFVKVLIMGWDSPRAKGLIDMAPGISHVDTAQCLGRVTRPYEDEEGNEVVAQAITIVDDTAPKGLVTFPDVLGEKIYRAGKVFGSRRGDSKKRKNESDGLRQLTLTPEQRALIYEIDEVRLNELAMGIGNLDKLNSIMEIQAQQTFMPTDEVALRLGMSEEEIAVFVAEHELDLYEYEDDAKDYLLREDVAKLVKSTDRFAAPELRMGGYYAVNAVAADMGLSTQEFTDLMEEMRAVKHRFADADGIPDIYISKEELQRLRLMRNKMRSRR